MEFMEAGTKTGRTRLLASLALAAVLLALGGLLVARSVTPGPPAPTSEDGSMVKLPPPDRQGEKTLESMLDQRRSHRNFASEAVTLAQLGQLMWAAQGCTTESCFRTAPSAGGLFPLEVVVVTGKGSVEGLDAGAYIHRRVPHTLELLEEGDHRKELAKRALGQGFIADAPITIVVTGDVSRTAVKYGTRAERYVHMEVGHVGQNVALQAEALGLGTTTVGAFDDEKVRDLLSLPAGLEVYYLLPVGKPLD